MRYLIAAFIALAFACIPFGGHIPSAQAAGTPFEIYALLSLTGPLAFAGKEEQTALALLEKSVNSAGGVRKRPIHFVVYDTQSISQVAVQLANELITRRVPVFIGPDLASQCLAIYPLIQKNGPVEYCLSPSAYPQPGGYMFSASAGTEADAMAIVRYFRDRGWTRVALITSTDATGQSFEAYLNRTLTLPSNQAMTLVTRQYFNVSDISVSGQVNAIRAQNPQAIIAWTTGTPFGTVLRSLRDVGLDVPLASSNGNTVSSQLQQYRAFMPPDAYFAGTLAYAGGLRPGPIRDAQTRFANTFKAAGLRPDYVTANAWDPGAIVVSAFEQLGFDATAEQIHAYLEGLHSWVGIDGVYDFRDGKQRGIGPNAVVVNRYDSVKDQLVTVSRPGGSLR